MPSTDPKTVAALAHPARRAALHAVALRPTCPEQVATDTGQRLGTIAYHFRALHAAGLIELDHTERVRGAVRHVYRLAPVNGLSVDVAAVARDLKLLANTLARAGRKPPAHTTRRGGTV